MSFIDTHFTASLKPLRLAGCVMLGALSFHVAFAVPSLAPLVILYLGCLVEMTRAQSSRQAFYSGLAVGLCIFVPHVRFFWSLFGPLAMVLWAVLAFWHGLFVLIGRSARLQLGSMGGLLLLPFIWTGLEYFRSELYYLRFSWLASGFVFNNRLGMATHLLGVYGIGFLLMSLASAVAGLQPKLRALASVAIFVVVSAISYIGFPVLSKPFTTVEIAGMQLEFPASVEVSSKLDELKGRFPEAGIYVLSEYTFDGPVPAKVLQWCKTNGKYLVVGGKAPGEGTNFYNTAFVAGPKGEIVFEQAKAVPIQFFADGLPAAKQRVWESPWGKIGFCVCYDLSYTRVVDQLARLGAQALIVPTMDVADWGEKQHQLHARIAPMRAAEYGLPIFRLASSGISQVVDAAGKVEASAPYPGEGEMLHGFLEMRSAGRLPADRVFAPLCVLITAIAACLLAAITFQKMPSKRVVSQSATSEKI